MNIRARSDNGNIHHHHHHHRHHHQCHHQHPRPTLSRSGEDENQTGSSGSSIAERRDEKRRKQESNHVDSSPSDSLSSAAVTNVGECKSCALDRLSRVELQLIMHFLDREDKIRFGRTTKRLYAALDDPFAWSAACEVFGGYHVLTFPS